MTKLYVVDLCYQKMLTHYSNHGMSGINKPFEEVKQMIRDENKLINRIKRLFKGIWKNKTCQIRRYRTLLWVNSDGSLEEPVYIKGNATDEYNYMRKWDVQMEKLGCLSDEEKFRFYKSKINDTKKAIMIGNATALYFRFKSIENIDIDFYHSSYHLSFKNFVIVIKANSDSIEELYQEVEREII